MNWDALQAVAEIIAALGVLASLAYVGVQIKHNTASLQAATVSQVAEQWSELRRAIWRDPEVVNLYQLALSGREVADPVMTTRIRAYWLHIFKDTEAVFYQHRSGQLPEEIWQGYRKELALHLGTPGAHDAAAAWAEYLSESYVEFLKAEMAAIEGSPLDDMRARYERAAAERRAREGR